MSVPSHIPSDDHERGRPSPVDSPYTNARSPSGHLIPYSPTPSRRYSRDHIPWMTGSQTSLQDEPTSINHDSPQVGTDLVLRPSSGTAIHTHHGSHTPTSDVYTYIPHPPSPLPQLFGFTLETSLGNPGIKTHSAHVLHANNLETYRSRTPSSTKSSQSSISRNSCASRNSVGRESYRENRGPRARARTPVPGQDSFVRGPSSSPTRRSAELGSTAAPENIIAPPSVHDPNLPGEPIRVGNRFSPMSVNGILRYETRPTRLQLPSDLDYMIDAMTYQYPEIPEDLPVGWEAYRHPEGALYFVHGESKTFTEVNVCNEQIHTDIEYYREYLLSALDTEIKGRHLSESLKVNEVQLVLEPKLEEKEVICCYYFVNPRTRSLFWLDEWDGDDVFRECVGMLSAPHKGLAIQAHYWCAAYVSRVFKNHWNFYPNFCEVTQELKDEVVDMILHATSDHLTSHRSSCPLNSEELNKHLSLVERIDAKKKNKRGHCAVIIGRIMHIFYHNHFLNFYGEDCARLNFDQTIHGWKYHPSQHMKIFAPLLFMAPVNNVRLLHKIFVDNIASKEKWNMFIDKLKSELQETSVLATVLLNANVAFLPKQSDTGVLPQQILSYSSLVASMASIILGLVFMGHSRTESRNTPFEAAKFLHELQHERHGLETLAIIYSLPHAFLMWGMLFFFAAFAVQWYYLANTASRAFASVFIFVVAFLVTWCIWTARDRHDSWWFQPDSDQVQHNKGDGTVFPGTPIVGLDFLRWVPQSLIQIFSTCKTPPGESHLMQDTASLHVVVDPPNT